MSRKGSGLLLQCRRPVLHQRDGFGAFLQIPAVDEKLIPIRSHVVRTKVTLDSNRLKQSVSGAQLHRVAGRIHIDRNYIVQRIEKEHFLAIAAPFRRRPAIARDLPLSSTGWKGSNVDL